MAAVEQKLYVFAHINSQSVPCGQLTLTEDGPQLLASSFAYGLRYVLRPDALEVDPVSLSLANKTAVRGKTLFPAGDLSWFGGIRDAAPDAWGRRVIESRLKVPANSLPESTYLLHAGSQRVGALDVRPSRDAKPSVGFAQWGDLQHLMEAARHIDEGLPVPAHLEEIFVEGSPLGGARPKATVRDQTEILWLAKFPSAKDSLAVPVIEAATLRLAAVAGLTVPAVQLVELGTRTVMLIRRFDRYWASPGPEALPEDFSSSAPGEGRIEKRLGFVSGLTLMACDEMESPNKSYGALAGAIRRYCHPDVIRDNNRELFERLVFNILVSNDDDHLRNHGFLWDPRIAGWRLSPLYDVMPRPSVASERNLHLGVGPQAVVPRSTMHLPIASDSHCLRGQRPKASRESGARCASGKCALKSMACPVNRSRRSLQPFAIWTMFQRVSYGSCSHSNAPDQVTPSHAFSSLNLPRRRRSK